MTEFLPKKTLFTLHGWLKYCLKHKGFVAERSKALDSSSSPSCGRGFESHRNHHFAHAKEDWIRTPKKCFRPGSNRRPWDYETHALPTAPRKQDMRHPGIEPGAPRWQRGILPLNQWRFIGWQNDPGGTRTPNRLIRSQARYPLRHRTFDM